MIQNAATDVTTGWREIALDVLTTCGDRVGWEPWSFWVEGGWVGMGWAGWGGGGSEKRHGMVGAGEDLLKPKQEEQNRSECRVCRVCRVCSRCNQNAVRSDRVCRGVSPCVRARAAKQQKHETLNADGANEPIAMRRLVSGNIIHGHRHQQMSVQLRTP